MKNKGLSSLKIDKKLIIKSVVLVLIPFFSCLCLALFQGKYLFNIYLPNSEYNDEILYYKQIESILKYGYPRGYFGYNESCSKILTFSSWSPVILYPIAFVAKLFFLGHFFPYIINMLFMALALLIFSLVYRPNWLETAEIACIIVLFVPLSRYQLSVMADTEIISLCIMYMSFYMRAEKNRENGEKISTLSIVMLFIFAAILSLMRPYFLLLFLFPAMYSIKKDKKYIWVSAFILLITVVLYAVISSGFTAAYFIPLIQTNWIKGILTSPIAGTRQALSMFAYGCRVIIGYFGVGLSGITLISAFWVMYTLLTLVTILCSYSDKRKRIWACFMVLFAVAVIMFYDINVGVRHLLPYMVMVLMLFISTEKKAIALFAGLMLAIILLFTSRMNNDPAQYKLPDKDDKLKQDIELISEGMSGLLDNGQEASRWDNTVIWVWKDEDVSIHWNELYGIPSGFGINMCTPEYIESNWGTLKSKYIVSTPNGFVSKLCERDKMKLVAETDRICVWEMR